MKSLSLFVVVLLACGLSTVRAGQYFQDFNTAAVGAQSFGDGSQLFTTASGTTTSVQDATLKALQLTTNGVANTRAAFLLPDLDPGVTNFAFSARWNAKISGNFNTAADGFSFNFGQLAALNLTNTAYLQEGGYPTGLCFSVKTTPGASAFVLRLDGNNIASQTFDSATQWGVNSTTNHLFEVDWNYSTGLTVRVDGQTIFNNISTSGFKFQGGSRFVWAARTGAATETVQLDNLLVMTGGNLSQLSMTSPYYKSGEYLPANQTADKAFDGLESTKWLTQQTTGYVGATSAFGNRVARAYAIETAEDVPTRDPQAWMLQGSVNSGANWTTCGTGSIGSFGNRHEIRYWLATNASGFDAFRLNITTNAGGPAIQLAELTLFEFQPIVASAPTVSVSPAFRIGPVRATTTVTPLENGFPTTTWLMWGPTTSYGTTQQVIFAQNAMTVLTPQTTYNFRAMASNALGIAYSANMVFTTLSTNFTDLTTSGDALLQVDGVFPINQDAYAAFDDSVATKYRNFSTNGGTRIFPYQTNLPLRALTLISAEDAPERDPGSFTLEGSLTGSSFTLIASNAVPAFAGRRTIQTIPIDNETAYVAYRVLFPTVQNPALADSLQIAEVELLPFRDLTPLSPGPNFILPPGAALDQFGVVDRSLADGGNNRLQVSAIPAGQETIVQLSFDQLTRAQGFEWIGASDDTSFPGRTPGYVKVQGFDNLNNFTQLLSVTSAVPTMNLQIHGFTFPNTNWFSGYRFVFGPPMSGSVLQLGEVRIFGETAPSPALTISRNGNQVTVQWPDAPGFHLEYRTNLLTGSWLSNSTPAVLNGGINSVTNAVDAASRFYRLTTP